MRPLLLAALSAIVLTGCGGGDDAAAGSAAGAVVLQTPAAVPEQSPGTASPGTASPAAASPPALATLPSRPAPDQCVDLEPAEDGRSSVFDAGSAVVTRDGDRLVLGEVAAAAGWTARVDDDEGDSVEIDFRRDGEVLDLEVEIDDGRLDVEVCNDDD